MHWQCEMLQCASVISIELHRVPEIGEFNNMSVQSV
jgi:hypothetical protein